MSRLSWKGIRLPPFVGCFGDPIGRRDDAIVGRFRSTLPRMGRPAACVVAVALLASLIAVPVTSAQSVPGADLVAQADAAPTPRLDWVPCAEPWLRPFECASAAVPLDYARPQCISLHLAVVRQPARDPARRVGTLFLGLAGPGQSVLDTERGPAGDPRVIGPLLEFPQPLDLVDSSAAISCADTHIPRVPQLWPRTGGGSMAIWCVPCGRWRRKTCPSASRQPRPTATTLRLGPRTSARGLLGRGTARMPDTGPALVRQIYGRPWDGQDRPAASNIG